MRQKRHTPFEITGMDSLGQGVSKLGEKVTFIAKTVIGDKGEAEIISEKKGVAFAKATSFSQQSSSRIRPECIHFDTCPSCHYLHVDYSTELAFKKDSFKALFRKLSMPDVRVIASEQRFHYRNRVQLHYSLKTKLLGMRDPSTRNIIPIPECLIAVPEVTSEIKRLYQNQNWLKEAPRGRPEGHVEIYATSDGLKVSWNRPYAEGGFTQVFAAMNQKLKNLLLEEWQGESLTGLLDIFGGNGNLSNDLQYSQRLCVDQYSKLPGEEFFSQNLYDQQALPSIKKELKRREITVSHLLLDPPRSGLKDLSAWLAAFQPKSVAYVSCDPHTLVRDLQQITDYRITKAFLIDFFPSTFHFESFVILERNN